MGFWKEFFSNMDEPAIIIQTKRTIEIPDEMLLHPRRKQKQIGRNKAKEIDYVDVDYELLE